MRAQHLELDYALEILLTHRHFWKDKTRFYGILSPLSVYLFFHPGFMAMFQRYIAEWYDAVRYRTFFIEFTNDDVELLRALSTIIPKTHMIKDILTNQRKPFVQCVQVLVENGYTWDELKEVIDRSCRQRDEGVIQWLVEQGQESVCTSNRTLVCQFVVQRNALLLHHHELWDQHLQTIIVLNSWSPNTSDSTMSMNKNLP